MKASDWLASKGKDKKCTKCDRKSASVKENEICNMPQPNGEKCKGVFKNI